MAVRDLKKTYEQDSHLWYSENARLIREKKFNEKDKLESFLIILFLHLLKLNFQSNYEVGVRSWKLSVKEHRLRAKKHLKNNPSLKGVLPEIIQDAYNIARLEAAQETGLSEETFPMEMPFTFEQAFTDDWLP